MPQFSIYDDGDQIETVKAALKTSVSIPSTTQPRRLRARISAAKSQLISPRRFAEREPHL